MSLCNVTLSVTSLVSAIIILDDHCMLRQDSSVDLDAGAKRVALISQNLPKLTATHIICGNLYMPKNLNFLYSYRGSYVMA